jgi:serine/threonine-protein kinase
MTLGSGTRLGPYIIDAPIGAGGMGEVYKALDPRLQRHVAIKVLKPARVTSDGGAELIREARAASGLSHPHICTVHEIGEAEGRTYIVMELVPGITLKELIASPVAPETVLRYGTQLADALAHAHARGVVHGDLKCANVMVTPEARIKVLDFGLARRAAPDPSLDTHSDAAGQVVAGTPAYMAPEVLRGQPPDVRSDIWAIGVVLFELLSGTHPFAGDSRVDMTSAILRDPPRELPDGIPATLKAAVHRALAKDPPSRYADAGQFAAALQILQVDPAIRGEAPRRRSPSPGRRRAIRSIAVLPLENLSADPAQDYFADGLTEALITELARLGSLRVPSRTSVMRYRNSSKSARQMAAELDVQALLEGSIVRIGDRVRVTAQLIDAASDTHLWTDTYDRDVRDIFALYSDLAKGIAAEVQVRGPKPAARARVDPAAYEALLRGQHLLSRRTESGMRRAVGEFEAAIAADPRYVPAHVGQADAFNLLGYYGEMPPRDAFPRAKAAARRALEIDAGSGEAYASLGYATYYYDWEWAEAHAHFRRALELNPRSAVARHWYSTQLAGLGDFDRALKEIEAARELDRLSLPINVATGLVLVLLRDYHRAIEVLSTCLELDPAYPLTHAWMAVAAVAAGQFDRARDAARTLELTSPENPALCAMVAYALARTGDRDAASGALHRLTHPAGGRYIPQAYLAVALAGGQSWTEVLAALGRALEDRSFNLVWPRTHPVFDPVRGDPEFQRLLAEGRLVTENALH